MAGKQDKPNFMDVFARGKGARAGDKSGPKSRSAVAPTSLPQLGLFGGAAGDEGAPVSASTGKILGTSAKPAGGLRVMTVRELVNDVRQVVETGWADVWVEGEVSNLHTAPSGHMYWTLKDGDAQLAVVMFRRAAGLLRFAPEDGMQVLVRGRVSVYEQRGQLQLVAETAEPRGVGALQVAFEQLKARLTAEGLFDAARKRSLPAYAKTIGVITAAKGAVIHDIVTICRRRAAGLGIVVYPAAVQGADCAAEFMAGLQYFNAKGGVDLILLARGGGSTEDLAGFNDEGLARAIAASKLPVVSAIGHETDFTIADFAADVRAATPSAAAEMITDAQHRVDERIDELRLRVVRGTRFRLMQARKHLAEMSADAALERLSSSLSRRQQRVDDLRQGLEDAWREHFERWNERRRAVVERLRRHDTRRRTAAGRGEWRQAAQRLGHAAMQGLERRRARVATARARLIALSPMAVLTRGYALVFDERGVLIKSIDDAPVNSIVTTRLADGSLQTKVIGRTRRANA